MARNVTIALGQHDCVLGDRQANLKKMEEQMRAAASQGADIICFPELGGSGYRQDLLGDRLFELAEDAYFGETAKFVGALCQELNINAIAPLIEKSSMPGVVYNSVIVIDRDGDVLGSYRKNHYYATEGLYFALGQEMPVFDLDFGTVGVMICYDMGLPEVARILTLQGAEVIFVPSAWCQEDEDIWDINIPCRALENRLFVAAVNRVGTEGETLTMHGKSKVAGPRGETRVEGKRFEEDVVVCTVDLDEIPRARQEIPYLKSRKPYAYSILTEME